MYFIFNFNNADYIDNTKMQFSFKAASNKVKPPIKKLTLSNWTEPAFFFLIPKKLSYLNLSERRLRQTFKVILTFNKKFAFLVWSICNNFLTLKLPKITALPLSHIELRAAKTFLNAQTFIKFSKNKNWQPFKVFSGMAIRLFNVNESQTWNDHLAKSRIKLIASGWKGNFR